MPENNKQLQHYTGDSFSRNFQQLIDHGKPTPCPEPDYSGETDETSDLGFSDFRRQAALAFIVGVVIGAVYSFLKSPRKNKVDNHHMELLVSGLVLGYIVPLTSLNLIVGIKVGIMAEKYVGHTFFSCSSSKISSQHMLTQEPTQVLTEEPTLGPTYAP